MTAIETRKQARRSQRQIEDFALRAYDAQCAAEALDVAFRELADYPEEIGEAVHQLLLAATFIANDALSWAQLSNVDFDLPTP